MDRRTFLAGASLATSLARAQQKTRPATVPQRRVYSLNRNWLYRDKPTSSPSDTGFTRVTLPHTNIELPWHSFDDRRYEFVSSTAAGFTRLLHGEASVCSWISPG
jgi:beta-galactosidase